MELLYTFGFIAGAISFGALHARAVVVQISLAIPLANLLIVLAVAGAISKSRPVLVSS